MELNKAVLDCMQSLRRKLRAEQNLVIRLSQPDAIATMIAACQQSSDPETRALGQRLAEHSHHEERPTITPPARSSPDHGPVLIYRGQRIHT
ncbi:hypothetical protein [Stutzerimonas tarimensis]|uniref:Uncharacterized protein n=1 Tax=Stutzerimonas tarimensis TaxID=1507735 RepID=A0ABV7T519_9GAMM